MMHLRKIKKFDVRRYTHSSANVRTSGMMITAIIIVIFLYILVPLLLFFLSIGFVVAAIYFYRFMYLGNINDGIFLLILICILLSMVYLLLRLIRWLKQ